ncbi:DUF397 domain-containing protein [Solihabitans fulvus]|uniref:DUF397 domain-containing protein n=1 Tax=Solihabitans fulvus TaxID=1892852 RepID=A0A5B2WW00_9PSEU|nr:DUF397 domain-containing protein [Solihabitans fulvus]KAA2255911.1 DUF397 domain-containing protein [Solihabitans fulvus]
MSTVDLSNARWRKSSHSGHDNASGCVEVALLDSDGTQWRKSSHSTSTGDGSCVEVAFSGPATALRDSKNPDGPTLILPATQWTAFLGAVKHDTFA